MDEVLPSLICSVFCFMHMFTEEEDFTVIELSTVNPADLTLRLLILFS